MDTVRNSTALPPLPFYTLTPLPPLIAPIPDKLLIVIAPFLAYWVLSLFFHWIDEKDYFAQWRLHTPAEVLKRNHVTKWEVIRDVVIQQIIQTVVGILLGMTEPDDFFGKEEYDVAVWARRLRVAQRLIPGLLGVFGINASGLADNLSKEHPMISGIFSGGIYPLLGEKVALSNGLQVLVPAFAQWELVAARAIYWVIVPAIQFGLAIFILDTWQYFLHRAMHMNKWLYSKLS